jgi:putative Mn2+ efflux pump MntP
MRRVLEWGGVAAGAILIAFGVVAIVMGVNGRSTVQDSLKQEQITGTSDMSPSGIAAEVKAAQTAQAALFAKLNAAGVKLAPSEITTPSCTVAGQSIDNGDKARCFAEYMRIHTYGATSGLTYSQMGRFRAKTGAPLKATDGAGGTSDPANAAVDPTTKQPVNNGLRDLWVTYTALTTALNSSYMASQLALFGIVVGVALLLSGIGFMILALFGALRPSALIERAEAEVKPTPATGMS